MCIRDSVFIIDGGFRAWDAADFDTVAGPGNVTVRAAFTAQPHSMPMVEIDQVRDFAGLLIDARDAARYEGRRELLDLKAGHIPGALNLPVGDLLDADASARWHRRDQGPLRAAWGDAQYRAGRRCGVLGLRQSLLVADRGDGARRVACGLSLRGGVVAVERGSEKPGGPQPLITAATQ